MERDKVIKALECCTEQEYCGVCPCDNECIGMESLMLDALSLIKELTEENEKLKIFNKLHEQDVEDMHEMLEKKVEEVYPDFMRDYKCLRDELDGVYEELKESREDNAELRADTVRKMRERIGEYFVEHNEIKYGGGLIHKIIDQIAKEMLEDTNES